MKNLIDGPGKLPVAMAPIMGDRAYAVALHSDLMNIASDSSAERPARR